MTGRTSKEVAIYLKAINQMGNGCREAIKDLEGIEKAGDKVFKGIAKAGIAAFAAITTAATAVGAAFEQGLANTSSMFITAARSAQELGQWTDELEAKARALGATTAFSAREAVDAMYALASGGMSAAQTVEASEAVLKLAGATMFDMTGTAEVTMSTLRQFKLEAKDTTRVTNVFAAGIQNSMLNMERLRYAMVYAGPQASALGMSIEETTGALAVLHNAGLLGSIAGTGLRMAFSKLLKPTKELKSVLGDLSLSKDGLPAVIQAISDANLSAEQMTEMFGARAFNAVKALTDAGAEGLESMTKALTGTNAAMDMYERQMDTVRSQAIIIKSAMEETWISIFDVIQPTLRDIIAAVQDYIERTRGPLVAVYGDLVAGAEAAWPTIVAFTGEVVAGMQQMMVIIRPMGIAFESLFGLISRNTETLGAIARAWGAVTIAVWAYVKAMRMAIFVTTQFTRKNAVLLSLIALVYWFEQTDDRTKKLQRAWVEFSGSMKWLGANIRHDWNLTLNQFWLLADAIMGFPGAVKETFRAVLETIGMFVVEVGLAAKGAMEALMNPFTAKESLAKVQADLSAGMARIGANASKDFGDAWKTGALDKFKEANEANEAQLKQSMTDLTLWYNDAIIRLYSTPPNPAGAGAGGVVGGSAYPPMEIQLQPTLAPLGAGEIPSFDIDDMPEMSKITDGMRDAWTGLSNTMKSSMQGAWDSIIDSSASGSEKWQAIWGNATKGIWRLIGQTVTKKLIGDQAMLASSNTTTALETANNERAAASGFFKAYAGLPFVGQVLALGAIAAMLSVIGSMHTGGLIGNQPGSYQEKLFIGQDGEFVMPVQQTARYLPELDAMRTGAFPAISAAGNGGPSMTLGVTVQVSEGSLLIAEDDLAVRRFAEKIHNEIETRISRKYRGA